MSDPVPTQTAPSNTRRIAGFLVGVCAFLTILWLDTPPWP
jgi:hypothetical protein